MKTNEELISKLEWNNNIKNREEKEVLARIIASKVKNGDVISFGSGTTSFLAILEISKKCKEENIQITAVTTSNQIELLCKYLEIPTVSLENTKINWGFDGADEVNSDNWLIKGLGGAMYREKRNIVNTPKVYILVDKSKLVENLGKNCPVPVECEKEKYNNVIDELLKIGAVKCEIRKQKNSDEIFITDNNNYIVDAWFDNIDKSLERNINKISGVVENGLFIGYSNLELLTVEK